MLGFNVDPNFSNALDALLMADLRTATTGMLERCMGRAGAAEFRARWSPQADLKMESLALLSTM